MKKMKTLFEQENYRVVDKLREENKFILGEDFSAYVKRDGTSVMIKDNVIYKRYDANEKKGRKVPEGAILCEKEPGPSGSFPVWVKCKREESEDKFHFEAFDKNKVWKDGTYELCGPKINGNKEKLNEHILIKHDSEEIFVPDMSFNAIKTVLTNLDLEGFVIQDNKTGLMTKIRRKDFGLKW